jgi:TolB protein
LKFMLKIVFFLVSALLSSQAHAILTIDIVGGRESALPIAIATFGWPAGSAAPPIDVAQIVRDNLQRSGRFAPLPSHIMPAHPTTQEQVRFDDWRMLGTFNLVIGRVLPGNTAGQYTLEFELFDVLKNERSSGYQFHTASDGLRRTAHQISDLIYEALLGEKSAFNTRIAYITVGTKGNAKEYRLYIADIDGAHPHMILSSVEPLLSPAWSPDATRLSYVSFEGKRVAVYVQDIRSGQREQIAAWKGLNTAPAWSPDGSRLALSLSKDGNPEIYILTLANRALTRITDNPAIDTEPSWMPDGNSLLFTSDRGGAPQIYQVSVHGGTAKRLTFQGNYNARPQVSPDGQYVALINGSGGAYRIAVMNLATGQMNILTTTNLDESPSFAPNSRLILYASGNELAAVSIDGKVRQRLSLEAGMEVREPAWSPFLVK